MRMHVQYMYPLGVCMCVYICVLCVVSVQTKSALSISEQKYVHWVTYFSILFEKVKHFISFDLSFMIIENQEITSSMELKFASN